jgi:translation initiation factor 5B
MRSRFEYFLLIVSTQPFVLVYAQAVGKAGGDAANNRRPDIHRGRISLAFGLMTSSIHYTRRMQVFSASRLIFVMARNSVLPMSNWITQVNSAGQPRNAITIVYLLVATILCAMLPSQVAFFSWFLPALFFLSHHTG